MVQVYVAVPLMKTLTMVPIDGFIHFALTCFLTWVPLFMCGEARKHGTVFRVEYINATGTKLNITELPSEPRYLGFPAPRAARA